MIGIAADGVLKWKIWDTRTKKGARLIDETGVMEIVERMFLAEVAFRRGEQRTRMDEETRSGGDEGKGMQNIDDLQRSLF